MEIMNRGDTSSSTKRRSLVDVSCRYYCWSKLVVVLSILVPASNAFSWNVRKTRKPHFGQKNPRPPHLGMAPSSSSSLSSTLDHHVAACDPLGPPEMIRGLPTNKRNINIQIERPYFDPSFEDLSKPQQHSYTVNRIAQNSDVFLLKGFLTEWECEAIMDEAQHHYKGGMTKAISQDENTTQTRTKCHVAWLGDSRLGGICGMIGEAIEDTFISGEAKDDPLSKRSDLQVLNYQHGGKFVLHHDDHDRMLTVITYLNGVGETWMPLVDVVGDEFDGDDDDDKKVEKYNQESATCQELRCLAEAIQEVNDNEMSPGSSGILVSGSIKKDSDEKDLQQLKESISTPSNKKNIKNPHVVSVDQGDAIAFYSYQGNDGKQDWRSIHAGLPVEFEGKEGKWIATSWYHAPSLTASSSN
jgi:2OG-Fe(II) oxygenase superfamily.